MIRPPRNTLILLLAAAFVLRLAAGWAWQSRFDQQRFGMGDSESYWTLGLAIADGKPYECGPERAQVFRTPGYPMLLAPVAWLLGDNQKAVLLARAEAALLGTLAVAAVWWLTRLLFDRRAALLAAALATIYPEAIALGALILSEAPFAPLMLLQLVLWTLAWQAPSKTRMAILGFCGGLAAGAATLMRPSWLLFTPLAALVGVLAAMASRHAKEPRASFFRHLLIGSCMILGLVVAMLPWWIRNARNTGRFVPTTLQVGASLYDGLNPEATGASNMDFVPRFVAEQLQADGESKDFEVQLDRRMRTEALAWAKANPGRAVQLAGVKFLRMWNIWPNEPRLNSWPIRLAVFFTYTPLLIFAIIGAWRTLGRGWPYILCWLPAVYLTMLHVVFVSSIRYREPAMLALLALAAAGVEAGIGDWGLDSEQEATKR
jgi:4-amino-4-deoxy-L-arabinose transferase-like glycosyltransferase